MVNHTAATLGSLLLGCAIPVAALGAQATPPARVSEARGAIKQAEFQDSMRELWSEHVNWTRQFIVSAAANLPDKAAATERLLENQEDIGDAIKPYYGDAAGEQLTTLLKEHITVAAELVNAAAAKQSAQADAARQRWAANADTISAFLSRANPRHWRLDELKKMMHEHLSLTTDEATARLEGDWKADIEAYDKAYDQALRMADALSTGIIRQFPEKFDRRPSAN
jgi:hypothetical protein